MQEGKTGHGGKRQGGYRRALAGIAMGFALFASGAHAQTGEGMSSRERFALAQEELRKEADAPSIPIFFGQAYQGQLSAENGTKAGWRAVSRWDYRLERQPVAYFHIDLLEKESLTYGLWTDSPVPVRVELNHEKAGKDGRIWVTEGFSFSSHTAGQRCVKTVEASKSRRYRFEISVPADAPAAINYRLFILPTRLTSGCDAELPAETLARFDVPGQPASLAIAQAWKDRPFVPTLATPAGHAPEPDAAARAYGQDKPEALRGFYQALYVDGEHNAVLNFQRLGLAAMEAGEYREAEWAFDEALARIEAFYGQTATAKAARSKWTSEGIKDFKGEPYERVMAYYYRGLLYLRAGDYDNARAAFVAGEFQDTLSEAEEFQGDFALMHFLAGWSSYCRGDTGLADDAFAAAQRGNPAIVSPAQETTLVLADLGRGPVKFGRGPGRRLLTFVESDANDAGALASATLGTGKAARALPLAEYSNIAFQATTRGGRAFDAILDGKASLQTGMRNTAEVGYLLTQSGVLPLQVAGLLVTLASGTAHGKIKPDADVRVWDTLPHHVAVGLASAPATAPVAFAFEGTQGPTSGTPVMRAHHGRCGLAWSRSRSARDAAHAAPGNDADIVAARLKRADAVQRDDALRAALREAASNGGGDGAHTPAR